MIGCPKGYTTQHLQGTKAQSTVKRLEGVHSILKFANFESHIRNHRDRALSNRFKGEIFIIVYVLLYLEFRI